MSSTADEKDLRVLEIYDQLIEIEQRLIPTGLHVFGRPSETAEKADMLRMVVSFPRPEAGARALPDLVAEGLGLSALVASRRSKTPNESEVRERERVDSIVSAAIQAFLKCGVADAVRFLSATANVKADDSHPIFAL